MDYLRVAGGAHDARSWNAEVEPSTITKRRELEATSDWDWGWGQQKEFFEMSGWKHGKWM